MRLLRAREAVLAHVRPILRAHGFTEQQYRVLRALQNEGPLDAAELSRRATLLPSSLSRMLRDLRRIGLVEDVPAANGGRFARLRLSARGNAAVARAAVEVDAVGRLVEERLGSAQLRELERLLDTLEARMAGLHRD